MTQWRDYYAIHEKATIIEESTTEKMDRIVNEINAMFVNFKINDELNVLNDLSIRLRNEAHSLGLSATLCETIVSDGEDKQKCVKSSNEVMDTIAEYVDTLTAIKNKINAVSNQLSDLSDSFSFDLNTAEEACSIAERASKSY